MQKIKAVILPAQNLILDKISHYLDSAFPIFFFILANSFYLRSYDSAMIKITELHVFGTILIALWLCKIFESGKWPFKKDQTLVVLPFLAMLAWGTISFISSPLPLGSLDFYTRRILYVGLAMIAISEINSLKDFRRMTNWMVLTVAVCSIYGLIQFIDTRYFPPGLPEVGLDKFVWRGAFAQRIFSTFGNPNFFSNFLVIMTPILGALYLQTKRFYLLPLIVLMVANIYWTESKGPLMGLIAGTSIFTFLIVRFFVQSKKIKMLVFLSAGLAVFVLGGLVIKKVFYSENITSFSFRNYTWISTIEMIKEKPIIGNGIGTFWVLYPAYRRPAIFHIEGKHNTETDHAENEHLEVWFDEGLIGMGLWIWLIALISVGTYKTLGILMKQAQKHSIKNKVVIPEQAYYMLGLFSGFLGMLIHNNSDVSMRFVSSGTPFWILAGLNAALIIYSPLPEDHKEVNLLRPQEPSKFISLLNNILRPIAVFVPILVAIRIVRQFDWVQGRSGFFNTNEAPHFFISWGLFLLCSGVALWWFIQIALKGKIKSLITIIAASLLLVPLWGVFMGDVAHNRAIFFSKNGIWEKNPQYDAESLKFPPEYQMMYGGTPTSTFDKNTVSGKISGFLFPDLLWRKYGIGGALEHYELAGKQRPDFIMCHYFIGNVYSDNSGQNAEKSFNFFAQGDPAQGEIFRRKTEESFNLALKTYDKVKLMAPNYVQTHFQVAGIYHRWGDFLHNLAPLAQRYGRADLAQEYSKKSKELWKTAIDYYRLYYKIDPVYDQNFYRLAQVFIQLGDLDQAEQIYIDHIQAKECKRQEHQFFNGFAKPNDEGYPVRRYDLAGQHHTHDVVYNAKPEVWTILGDFYFTYKKDMIKVESCYKKAVELDPTNLSFQKKLAVFYANINQVAKAIEAWKQVQKIAPQDPDLIKAFTPQK